MIMKNDALTSRSLIYYLGSKQRMANHISDVLDGVCQGGLPVADLFCGSGSASLAISKSHAVVSVDVQEYARVICSALLRGPMLTVDIMQRFKELYDNNSHVLREVYAPILDFESAAVQSFDCGDITSLASIVECGCMLQPYRNKVPTQLRSAMSKCDAARCKKGNDGYDVALRHFGGTYFSYEQALCISAARAAVDGLPNRYRDSALALVLSAASHCASTVGGQFAQPLKAIDSSGNIKCATLRRAAIVRGADVWQQIEAAFDTLGAISRYSTDNVVVKGECNTFLKGRHADSFSAIYADPPYSRYHYSRYYHVLETIALGDNPQISINPATKLPARGVYRLGRYQSPYSTKGGAAKAFDELLGLASAKAPVLVLSYSPYPETKRSTPRMVTVRQLVEMAEKHYGVVEQETVDWVPHSKLNLSNLELASSEESEVLIVCRR